jgi:hypothetical protein
MNPKLLIWLGLFIGSTAGSFIPLLWGGNAFSFSAVFLSALGGCLGIWGGYRLSRGL